MMSQRRRGLSKGTLRILAAEPGFPRAFLRVPHSSMIIQPLNIDLWLSIGSTFCCCHYKLLMWPNSQHLWWIFSLQFSFLKISPNVILPRKRRLLPQGCHLWRLCISPTLTLRDGAIRPKKEMRVQNRSEGKGLVILVSIYVFALSFHKAKQKVAKAYCHPLVFDGTYSSKKHPVPWACSHMLRENVTS